MTRKLGDGLAELGVNVLLVGWEARSRDIRLLSPASAKSAEDFEAALRPPAGGALPWLFVPEIPVDLVANGADPTRIGRAYGLRTAALAHDLIPMKLSAHYQEGTLAQYRAYYRMFARVDLALTGTRYVAEDLRTFLKDEELPCPDIAVVPLPAQFARLPRHAAKSLPLRSPDDPLKLLAVSSWEPRKNLPRLIRAVGRAQERTQAPIHLTVVGRRVGFADHDAEVDALLAEIPNVVSRERVSDAALAALYGQCHASVYPSWEEGFGLPVLESLWLATPCICHCGSVIAEVAPGGGAWTIDMTDQEAITDALVQLAHTPELLARLEAEAVARPLRNWLDFARDVVDRLGLATAA